MKGQHLLEKIRSAKYKKRPTSSDTTSRSHSKNSRSCILSPKGILSPVTGKNSISRSIKDQTARLSSKYEEYIDQLKSKAISEYFENKERYEMFKEKGRRIKQESVILSEGTLLMRLGSEKEAIRVKQTLEKILQRIRSKK